ncbi:dihydrodipicolinate synthase family protein [Aciditerrimonas ferrireducens]|uniref:dihydrodipicolinate synthase family protein n=1 Tax=Aciditerrimonas ferrireducens TaxID=667306 RepID=UPI002003CE26|nr:dihydrodipicolinate synthase family protein [Aciditerrimonas ferrireducens]MCK4177039.1 dihydrodipicolinate synthase family protein [Aciditerrimonas ferrireducens]
MAAGAKVAPSDMKAWAQEEWRGVCNVIIPSFTEGARGLNEAGIRHDVRRNMELGFWGALLVSEAGTTPAEMRRFMEIAVDEGRGRHYTVLHGSFDSLQTTLAVARDARAIGVDGLLVAYPNSFYPRSTAELLAYTRALCEGTELAVILFCAPHYNFARLHPSGFPIEVWTELADVPNVVAAKYEVGQPGVVGSRQAFEALAGRGLLVCDPYEPNVLLWEELYGTPWVGTSNYEYYGTTVPEYLELARAGRREEALARYWAIQPARLAREQLRAQAAGANFNHRYLWKFQAWLQGYNGGPVRAPAMKLTDAQMRRAAEGLVAAGLIPEVPKDFGAFFEGRCPA